MKKYIALVLALMLGLGTVSAQAFDTSQDSGLLMLVNKTHTLPSDYVPEQTALAGRVPVTGAHTLRPEAAEAYERLYAAMQADGAGKCSVLSGYRSYATQTFLVNRRVNQRVNNGMTRQRAYDVTYQTIAPAGASEHQIGLAIDLTVGGGTSSSFKNSGPGKWMSRHGWEYGYILRYEDAKKDLTMISAEAWHYRYVGVPHAKLMMDNGWCFEEYIDYLHQNGKLSTQIGDTVYDVYWTADADMALPAGAVEDISNDNAGGWVLTLSRPADPLQHLRGHWAEASFQWLVSQGVTLGKVVDPNESITSREFAALCALEGGEDAPLTREQAAQLLAPHLADQGLSRLAYTDLADIDPVAFQSVQTGVHSGLFSHGADQAFRPKAPLTWGEAGALAARLRSLGTAQ